MRLRVRLKSLALLAIVSLGFVGYNLIAVNLGSGQVQDADSTKHLRLAKVTAEDLIAMGRYSHPAPAPATVTSRGSSSSSALLLLPLDNNQTMSYSKQDPQQQQNQRKEISEKVTTPCDRACQVKKVREKNLQTLSQIQARRMNFSKYYAEREFCDRNCRLSKVKNYKLMGRGYSSRVQVENVTLPDSWTVTRELVDRLSARRNHVNEVCTKYGLDKPTLEYQPNAWEFIANRDYGLVWCHVFKAASSTWFYNFNLLAGYSEGELLQAKETPIQLARKRYPRLTVQDLERAMNVTPKPLTFLIARHPLKRLVSGYRDKILSGSRYYSKLSRTILKQYPELGPGELKERPKTWVALGKYYPRTAVPSFPQFVQFLLDESSKGRKLDEHWVPISDFCTPCLFSFDVYAKVETLEEDGNYIIFSAGIEDVIKPKRINRSKNEPTDEVADKFLCQLSADQMKGLLQLYKYDLELFSYDASKYMKCART